MSKPLRWPLAVSPFNLTDRLSVAWWVLRQDRYTMGERVQELEGWFSVYSGMYSLMVANGSLANTLVFELWKHKNPGRRPLVFVPAVTWISSITPALMAGMDIEFCDVNLTDFSFDYEALDRQIKAAVERGTKDIIIWPTALIGFVPDMCRLHQIANTYKASLFLDSCENTFSRSRYPEGKDISILASANVTTTSTYLSHQICSVEGGFVFFKDKMDYDLAKMFRNHGMSRSLPKTHALRLAIEGSNSRVDPQFLFALPGTNLRPSDVHAAFGLRDCKRAEKAREFRVEIYRSFQEKLDPDKYYLPPSDGTHVGFCLPIFSLKRNLSEVKVILSELGCESRPIIGSNLLYQPPFKGYGLPEAFPNAEWIHQRGCYVGLHHKVTAEDIDRLTGKLNAL